MIVNHRRALVLAGVLLGAAIVLGCLVAVPATRHGVQDVDDAVRRLAVSVQNRPTTLVAEGFSFAGSTWINWTVRIVALAILAFRRQYLQFTAFALAVVTSEILIGTLKAAYGRARPPGSLIGTSGAQFPVRACDRGRSDGGRPGARASAARPGAMEMGGARGRVRVRHGAVARVPARALALRRRRRRTARRRPCAGLAGLAADRSRPT